MTDLTFELRAHDLDPEAYKEIQRLEREKGQLIEGLKKKLTTHPRYIAACDLMGHSQYTGTKNSFVPGWNGRGFTINITLDRPAPKPKSFPQSIHIEPKVLNGLIHGKLLTDDEKRKLIAKVLPEGVIAEEAEE